LHISLPQIRTFVLTANPVRRDFVVSQLAKIGITPEFVEGIKVDPGIVGCGLSHLKILREKTPTPFLVLEDDCSVTEWFKSSLEVPSYTDCVYLGVSTWGVIPEAPTVGTNFATTSTWFNETMLRLKNMCSSHAILYTSAQYVEMAKDAILASILDGVPFDVGLARLQDKHLALTPRKPFFKQDARVGGHEAATSSPLTPTASLVR